MVFLVRICPEMESQRIENVGFVDRRPKRGDVRSLPQGSTEGGHMNLRDTSANRLRTYWVVTSQESRTVVRTKMAALTHYRKRLRDGDFPARLERFRLSAKHLDGVLAFGAEYFDQLPGELLREYDGHTHTRINA